MAVSYDEVRSYSRKVRRIVDNATDELEERLAAIEFLPEAERRREARGAFATVAGRYGLPAQELGAQWYELCAERAGVDVDAALVGELDDGAMGARLDRLLDSAERSGAAWADVRRSVSDMMADELRNASRDVITENLDRDERAARRTRRRSNAGYARVPVGETCAWCLMLASLGYWYRSEQTALGIDPDHYHAHCDCVAVPYYAPEEIDGYDDYRAYLSMYTAARDAYHDGDYSQEVAERIERARQSHAERSDRPWTQYNAILIVMREQNGLEH